MSDDVEKLLACKVIAVVGASTETQKPGHYVPAFMETEGYDIIPINPNAAEIFGKKCYPSLSSLAPGDKARIQVINVFRRPEFIPYLTDEIIRLKPEMPQLKGVWLQEGIAHPDSHERMRAAGLVVVADKCMKKEVKKEDWF